MTEEEKRQQKAMLLLEHQEAQDNLAHLREKAGRISVPIGEIAKWLSQARIHYANRDEERKRGEKIRADLETYRKAFDFDAILSVMDEIVTAEERLKELAERKASLNLK